MQREIKFRALADKIEEGLIIPREEMRYSNEFDETQEPSEFFELYESPEILKPVC